MASTPPKPTGAMSGSQFTKKVGPLPVWGWAVVILAGYLLYNHFKNATGTAATPSSGTDGQGTGAYVPPFDAASGGAGSVYTTPPPEQIPPADTPGRLPGSLGPAADGGPSRGGPGGTSTAGAKTPSGAGPGGWTPR